MINKLKKSKIFWNLTFGVLSILLFSTMHLCISKITHFSMEEKKLLSEVGQEESRQREAATRITKKGKRVFKGYNLGMETALKKEEANNNLFFIAILLLAVPFIIFTSYTLFTKLSYLAVNRNFSIFVINLITIAGIVFYEITIFLESGAAESFLIATMVSLLFIIAFSMIIAISARLESSPYYEPLEGELELKD